MPVSSPPRRVLSATTSVGVQVITGAILVLLGLAIRWGSRPDPVLSALPTPLMTLGGAVVMGALILGRRLPPVPAVGGCVFLLTLVTLVGLAEGICRSSGVDFRRQETEWRRIPPYYRQPRMPSGDVYFRRSGPEEWTGQVIRTWLNVGGWSTSAWYRSEPVITVKYGPRGFRGEHPLKDWETVVVGDSFVELGCLPYEQLFTSILAQETGQRVRNLGVSHTGPFTHLHYLESFGVAPSTRTAVVVFYEGNDLRDLAAESRAQQYHEETGKRGYRKIRRQSSLLAAARDAWFGLPPANHHGTLELPVRQFLSRSGPRPVTFTHLAPDPKDLAPALRASWKEFLERFREFGRRHGLDTWIAYMPCKARVLEGHLQRALTATDAAPRWKANGLPRWIADSCRRSGVQFLDLTPALQQSLETRGRSPFNLMLDTHLNALGSKVVGQTLAKHLLPDPEAPPSGPANRAQDASQPPDKASFNPG